MSGFLHGVYFRERRTAMESGSPDERQSCVSELIFVREDWNCPYDDVMRTGRCELLWLAMATNRRWSWEGVYQVRSTPVHGNVAVVFLVKRLLYPAVEWTITNAATGGYWKLMRAFLGWGATDVEAAFAVAVAGGHVKAAKLAVKMGAKDYFRACLGWKGLMADEMYPLILKWLRRIELTGLTEDQRARLQARRSALNWGKQRLVCDEKVLSTLRS